MTNLEIENGTLDDAHFEHINIPVDESFLWRLDDYPWSKNVWNYHPEFEIHLVRKSNGLCYVGDYIGNFEPGQLLMVGSNLPHNWVTLPAPKKLIHDRDIVLQFSTNSFLKLADIAPELNGLNVLFNRAALGLEFHGETAVKGAEILEQMKKFTGMRRFSAMLELLSLMHETSEVSELATNRFVTDFRPSSMEGLKKLELALTYIQENYLHNPKISEVANIVGMSESAFSRFFKNQTGNTYTDHLIELKIWTSKLLLRDTKTPITDICYEAGFLNISNFNRTFLLHTGMRPSDYRKAADKKNTPLEMCVEE